MILYMVSLVRCYGSQAHRAGSAGHRLPAEERQVQEIETLLENHVSLIFPNFNHHGSPHHTFTVGNQTFCVAEPHHSAFVKKVYVDLFLEAMEAVGLYDREG